MTAPDWIARCGCRTVAELTIGGTTIRGDGLVAECPDHLAAAMRRAAAAAALDALDHELDARVCGRGRA